MKVLNYCQMKAINELKNGKASKEDVITTELLQYGEETLHACLAKLFSRCPKDKKVLTLGRIIICIISIRTVA